MVGFQAVNGSMKDSFIELTTITSHRPHSAQRRHRSTSGNPNSGAAANPSRSSLRYCSEPSVREASSGAVWQLADDDDDGERTPDEDEYLQPHVVANGGRYLDSVDGMYMNSSKF